MRFRNLITKFTPLAIAALVGFSACSDMGTDSLEMSSTEMAGQTFQDETPDLLAGIDIEGAYEMGIYDGSAAKPTGTKTKLLTFAETNEDEVDEVYGRNGKWLIKSQLVSAEDGGIITFGTDKIGYSTLEVSAGAIPEDLVFTIVHKTRGKRDIFLFPEGVNFTADVTLRISLEGLNNRQKNRLENLRLWYHIPDVGWELVPSSSDGVWVTATLEHFSRYAVGSDS
mgnify:CR=1 FL=1